MLKGKIGLFVTFCFSFSIAFFAFKPVIKSKNTSQQIKVKYLNNIKELILELTELEKLAEKLNGSNKKLVRNQYLKCRNSLKRIEFLAAYLDEEFYLDHINGAPLQKLERNAPNINIIEPKGFQVIDELLFHEEVLKNKKELRNLIEQLLNKVKILNDFQKKINLTDRKIFEAVRYSLIRIYTLGLTGFDTPMSNNAIEDAKIGLAVLNQTISNYKELSKPEICITLSLIDQLFNKASEIFQDNLDFEKFDRLGFLKEVIDPLYSSIFVLQTQLNIETPDLVNPLAQAHNYKNKSLFSPDFLNPNYYAQDLIKGKDEAVLKLGKILFFDPILSANNKRSCASCHQPKKAFTDGMEKSLAFNSKEVLKRNSPTLINSVYSTRFFWDMRSDRLEGQFEHVIFSKGEFNSSYQEIYEKLNQSEEYVSLFKEAFPKINNEVIFQHTLSSALISYVKSLRGFNSQFDKYVRGEIDNIDEEVKNGFNLFMGKAGCGTCHFAPIFNGTVPPFYKESESEVLGVPKLWDTINPVLDIDLGRFDNKRVKENVEFYKNSFKTVTVRNAALTAPYMHNGAFKTLEEVLDFYNKGGGSGLGISIQHQTLPSNSLNLTKVEIGNIEAFLTALSDTTDLVSTPKSLPRFKNNQPLNERKIGGSY